METGLIGTSARACLPNRMRLVVAELHAFSHYVSREFAWIMRELIQVYGWSHVEPFMLAEGPGTFEEKMVRRCGERPRVVLFWGGEGFLCAFKSQIAALRCAKWFVADDLPESFGRAGKKRSSSATPSFPPTPIAWRISFPSRHEIAALAATQRSAPGVVGFDRSE